MKFKLKNLIKNLIFPSLILLFSILTYLIVNDKTNFLTQNNDLSMLMNQTKSEKKTGKKIQLKVLNGCGDKGVAILYTNFLRSEGYDVIEFGNASNFDFTKTKIIVHKEDNISFVNEIIDILKISSSQVEYKYSKNIFYEMSVIIGGDHKNLNSFNDVSLHYNPF